MSQKVHITLHVTKAYKNVTTTRHTKHNEMAKNVIFLSWACYVHKAYTNKGKWKKKDALRKKCVIFMFGLSLLTTHKAIY